jgi:hypothetical protein
MGQEGAPTKVLPDGWDQWTPDDSLLQLYINFDGRSNDTLPRIDILDENGSWPFSMQHLGDTVFLFVVPPGCELTERSTLDNLPDEFALVVWAGTKRAVYWFSYDAGKVEIDTLQPASFITTTLVKPFPPDVMYLLLPGSGQHAKTIKEIVQRLKGMAELIQLDDGFYQSIWCFVDRTTIRRWKLNETAAGTEQAGTLLVFSIKDSAYCADVQDILDEYR